MSRTTIASVTLCLALLAGFGLSGCVHCRHGRFEHERMQDGGFIHGSELRARDGVAVASDHTDVIVTGGAQFSGGGSVGEMSVTLTPIEAKTIGSPWDIDRIEVYAGSGDQAPSSSAGQVQVAHDDSPHPKTQKLTSFHDVPTYKTADAGYWIYVVVHGTHATLPPKTFHRQIMISVSQPTVEFPLQWDE